MNLNLNSVTDNIQVCLAGVSEKEWKAFFDEIRTQELAAIESASGDALTEIQNGCKMLSKIRGIFLSIRTQKPTADEQD